MIQSNGTCTCSLVRVQQQQQQQQSKESSSYNNNNICRNRNYHPSSIYIIGKQRHKKINFMTTFPVVTIIVIFLFFVSPLLHQQQHLSLTNSFLIPQQTATRTKTSSTTKFKFILPIVVAVTATEEERNTCYKTTTTTTLSSSNNHYQQSNENDDETTTKSSTIMSSTSNNVLWFQHVVRITAPKRGCHLITNDIQQVIRKDVQNIKIGMCNVFVQHTSASLTINENADMDVRTDMESALNKIVPESWNHDNTFKHTMEGDDDMPGHVKSSLMGVSLNIPISNGRLALGTWQGIYLNEHRNQGGYGSGHTRTIMITLQGQAI